MASDLISRKALIKDMYEDGYFPLSVADKALNKIEAQPTVDAVEVVHGEWESGICTNCGYHRPYVGRDYYKVHWNYCPNCGAKMDGEEVK